MYRSFIIEMLMYMSAKVTKNTCVSTTIQDYPSHMYMYPKASKPHVHVSEMSMYMSPKVHISKIVQATCTYIDMYISHKTHKNSSFLLLFLDVDPLGTTLGLVCISGSCKLNINC